MYIYIYNSKCNSKFNIPLATQRMRLLDVLCLCVCVHFTSFIIPMEMDGTPAISS